MTVARCLGGIILLVIAGALPGTASVAQPAGRVSWVESFALVEPASSHEVAGLAALEKAEGGMVQWVLLAGAGIEPLILTNTVDPCGGRELLEIQDDSTGWWARLENRYGYQGSDLADFFSTILNEDGPWSRHLELTLSSVDGTSLTTTVSVQDGQVEYAELSALLATREGPTRPRPPARFVSSLSLLLDRVPSSDTSFLLPWRGLIEVLLTRGSGSQAPAGPAWTIEHRGGQSEVAALDPESTAFLSQFRSVDRANLLAGHHLSESACTGNQRQD